MKMEIICDAPAEGIVESIGCTVTQLVEADQELVTLRLESAGVEPADIEAPTIP
jgi:hypothetical protein